MDNNFNDKPEQAGQDMPDMGTPDGTVSQGTPMNTQEMGTPNQGMYPPPPMWQQNRQMGYYPPPPPEPSANTAPAEAPAKKSMSRGLFWSLIAIILLLFAAIVLLSVRIAQDASAPDTAPENPFQNIQETGQAKHVEIVLPRSEKPELEDSYYQDKETGLLTSVGVAKAILPSQVQIKVFGEVPYTPVSSGSGVVLTEDGLILTNAHVVDGANKLSVEFYDGSEEEADIIGIDKKSDLAVISVEKQGLIPADLGTSEGLEIGEEVALAGAGGGFENTVTYGHVTGLGREIDTDYISSSTIQCIQSDAALNPGNSGGALVNMYGQVVGIAVALMNHETYENIGFCIAIDDAVPIAEDLIAYGYVSSRTRVGITYVSLGDSSASAYGVPAGLCVMGIDPASGAATVGLEPYDIITEIDGTRVFGAEEISEALADKVPGDVITISVFRKKVTGEVQTFTADLELIADTSSMSGYYVTPNEENFSERDIVK